MINIFLLYPKSVITLSTILVTIFYLLFDKAPKNTIIVYFWLHVLSYIGFSCIYILQESIQLSALKELIFDTSYYNLPLYLFSSLCTVGMYAIFDVLAKTYSIPLILALSQISLIMTTIGYIFLGDTVTITSLIGITVIFLGSIAAGCTSFSFKNPLQCLKAFDQRLLTWSIIKALLYSATILITYICIANYNETTKLILHVLTKHLRFIPCLIIAPIHFNIGIQFTTLIGLLLYIHYYLKSSKTILPTFVNNYQLICSLSVLYVLQAYFYYESYNYIENKNLITAITELYLPLLFLSNVYLFNLKSSKEEMIGMIIIVLGSIITVFG